MVSFKEAIRICLREKYVTFSGRASRSEFWWFSLFSFLLPVVPMGLGLILLFVNMQVDPASGTAIPTFSGLIITLFVIGGIIALALALPTLSVTVRRFHDRNLSGWVLLAGYVVSVIISASGAEMLSSLVTVAIYVVCMLKGTDGPNKYGPDPLNPAADADVFA